MEKLTMSNTFQKAVDNLKNTECSHKEKQMYFAQIVECIQSPSLKTNTNYLTYLSAAISTLLLFCEDTDSGTRMNAEENLNKIIRFCESGNIVRVQIELYHEIKKNGNERSLRICLNLFANYCHLIKQRKARTYAQNLLQSIFAISRRREILLLETLTEFLRVFCRYLQNCLNDNEVGKLIEIFLEDTRAACVTKRRCAAQNVITLIENSRKVEQFSQVALTVSLDFLLKDQGLNTVLGVMGFLRVLLPLILRQESCDYLKVIEIHELCLQYLNESNHSIINAALEVVNTILVNADVSLKSLLKKSDTKEILLKRKSLKNLVFHLVATESKMSSRKSSVETLKNNETTIRKDEAGGRLDVVGAGGRSANASEDKLDLSDMEMESLKSMDFETEIELSQSMVADKSKKSDKLVTQSSTESIGSFFNSILSHPNTESVSKFFRSSKSVDSPVKSSVTDDSKLSRSTFYNDDNLSLESMSSSCVSMQSIPDQSDASLVTLHEDETLSVTTLTPPEITVTTAQKEDSEENVIMDEATVVAQGDHSLIGDHSYVDEQRREISIGTILEQSIIEYTVRLICSKFLLAGVKSELVSDVYVRVSIKNLSLSIISNCVAIWPEILLISLERESTTNTIDLDLDLDLLSDDDVDSSSGDGDAVAVQNSADNATLELEIKDDHFGESSTKFYDLFSPLSKSLDVSPLTKFETPKMTRSEIVNTKMKRNVNLSKELSKILESTSTKQERPSTITTSTTTTISGQMVYDILWFSTHSDPVLRGNIQMIIGNFLGGTLNDYRTFDEILSTFQANEEMRLFVNPIRLLGIVMEGFFDEIHTVVKQALIAFETIIPALLQKKILPAQQYGISSVDEGHMNFVKNMSLAFLLDNLLLVADNRYWVVQCKFGDVIAGLNFHQIRECLGENRGCSIERQCREQLFNLMRDNDVRVRNHVATLLIAYIKNHGSKKLSIDGKPGSSPVIITDFVNQRIFNDLPSPLCELNRPLNLPHGCAKPLGQILYILSNKLLEIDDKNQQFGTINAIKELILCFSPMHYSDVWGEFKFLEICVNFMQQNVTLAHDFTCQSDMLLISTHLIAGATYASGRGDGSAIQNPHLKSFLIHILKLLNLYDILFTNVKPLVIPKGQKADMFVSAKELAALNKIGYFGDSHFYLKLYKSLKNAHESYKITINKEAGAKLFVLLKTVLYSLATVLELKVIENITTSIKFIEEILLYLKTIIVHVPKRCVICTRSLLKYLFGRNFVKRRQYYDFFLTKTFRLNDDDGMIEFFDYTKNFFNYNAPNDMGSDLVNYIKLFEPMVIYCLKLFTKSNSTVQSQILEMLCQLLEFKVNYCLLDANNVFIEFVLRHVDIIETGVVRKSHILIPSIMKFLFSLTRQMEKKIMTIPKVINITDNLLANNAIRNGSIVSLVELAYEIYFNQKIRSTTVSSPVGGGGVSVDVAEQQQNQIKDLNTQKEVVSSMLVKFLDYSEIQKITAIIMLSIDSYKPPQQIEILQTISQLIHDKKIVIKSHENFVNIDNLFQAFKMNVTLDSNNVELSIKLLLSCIQSPDISLNELGLATIILNNVILQTDEVYLTNQITYYFQNQSSSSEEGSLNGFVEMLYNFVGDSLQLINLNLRNQTFIDFFYQLIQCLRKMIEFPQISSLMCEKISEYVGGKNLLENVVTYGGGGGNDGFYMLMITFLVALDVNCLQIISIIDEQGMEEHLRNFVIGKFCDKMIKSKIIEKQTLETIFNKFPTVLLNEQKLFVTALLADSRYAKFTFDYLCKHFEYHTTEKDIHTFLEFCDKSSLSIANLIIQHLIDDVLQHKFKGVLMKKTIAICLNKLNNLETNGDDIFDSVEQHLKSTEFKTFVEKFTFDDKYLNIYQRFTKRDAGENLVIAQTNIDHLKVLPIDESWFINQVKYHTSTKSTLKMENIVELLSEIKTESKLFGIIESDDFNKTIFSSIIKVCFENIVKNFKIDCVQYNSHINYLKIPVILKITLNTLQKYVEEFVNCFTSTMEKRGVDQFFMSSYFLENFEIIKKSVINLLTSLDWLEENCLIFIEAKLLERYVKENFMKPHFQQLLLKLLAICFHYVESISCGMVKKSTENLSNLQNTLICIKSILQQQFVWTELNGNDEKYEHQLIMAVTMIYDYLRDILFSTNFWRKYKNPEPFKTVFKDNKHLPIYLKTIFIAKYMEERDNIIVVSTNYSSQTQETILSIATSVFRTNFLYSFAIAPFELFSNYNFDSKNLKENRIVLPSIPIDYLNDVEILEKFIKRINTFGFSSRQQFEEFFMSLLVLVNKENDYDVIDIQEQHQIKNMCLYTITELLLSCKMYSKIGLRRNRFYHSPRLDKIKIESITLKKLHKIQLLIPNSNIFYQPNLERKFGGGGGNYNKNNNETRYDNVIGTNDFLLNQIGMKYIWQLVEENAVVTDISIKNSRYFIEQAGIDMRSSLQLIHDVFAQLIDDNYVLVLPHLIKISEICEKREQFKWIKDTMLLLQEKVPMEDTISHQYIIYLLCKSYAVLVPSLNDLAQLCSIIPTYLKSSHLFIRNATLSGLLCLLESCVNTNTTIGSLGEELQLIRNVVINYIIKYGIIEDSLVSYSDTHTKLVWSLNFFLIEKTSKFVPDCNLLSNTIISANNILKNTTNLEQYLCILHGLERIVVTNTATKMQREKVEKLVLDLVKIENEEFSIPALKLLITCMYIGSADQIENTEHSNGIVQDEPEVIVQSIEKIDVLFMRIKSSKSDSAEIFGNTLCQIVKDLVPPNEILTKVIKELLSLSQPHCEVVAKIVFQVFRSAIDSAYHPLLQDWLICSLPNFVTLPLNKAIWCLSIIFVSASINLNIVKVFPAVLGTFEHFDGHIYENFIISSKDFYEKLSVEQKQRFRAVFIECSNSKIYTNMLNCL